MIYYLNIGNAANNCGKEFRTVRKIIAAVIFAALAVALAAFSIVAVTTADDSPIEASGPLEAAAPQTRDEPPAGTLEKTPAEETAYVRLTVGGASFTPAVELADGSDAAVGWYIEETGERQDGLAPAFEFGTEAVRHVRLNAAYPDGTNALGDIVTFNIGFDHTQDAGRYNAGSGYDYPAQCVTGLDGVNHMTGLIRFLAATPTLSGELDFSGMYALEFVECFGAKVSAVDLTGCSGLIRLCLEFCDLAELDLNPVSGSLRDLRLSGNQSTVTLARLNVPMARLYHYCAQSETVVGHPTAAQLPAIEEWWDWDSGQTGELVIRSDALRSVITCHNAWTSMDLTNQFPEGRNGFVEAYGCSLSVVELAGCPGLTYLDIHDNLLEQAPVDAILAEIASWGTHGGYLDLGGNAPPSDDGMSLVYALTERNWTVKIDTAT